MPTTVFTPLEYGSIGYSEDEAIAKFGENDLEVRLQVSLKPLSVSFFTVHHKNIEYGSV